MSVKYHPSDTTDIVKSELVFSLQEYYVDALNSEQNPWQGLCNEISISQDAYIEIVAKDERWRILDNHKRLLICNEKGLITVYNWRSDLGDHYIRDLNSRRVQLQDLPNNIRLSNRANIHVEERDKRWRIKDGRNDYLIWKEDNIPVESNTDNNSLTVYERMFDIQYRYASALNRRDASSKNLSTLCNQIECSQNANIEVLSRNNKWLITDEDNTFIVRKEQNDLNVYKRPTIENCALEYSYFLEIVTNPKSDKWDIEFPNYIHCPASNLITDIRDRQTESLIQFAKRGIKFYRVDAMVDWRLVVGLGREHVQETSMTFHHIYGVPYIPGTAVKGVLRHWWLQLLKDDSDFLKQHPNFVNKKDEIDESIALEDFVFRSIFGSQEQQGKVQFLDAYPTKAVNFATDIMNPHYPDYYSGSKPPTDYQNPIPINFLTVEKTTFRFTFLAKEQNTLDKLKNRFHDALEMKGVGAKSSVGYGYFRDFKDQTVVIANELKQQQEAVEEEQETKRIASLSPIEQLSEEIKRLTDKPVDEQRAVGIYNNELPSLVGDEEQMIALSLKDYWQRINKWDGGSDKQRQKVMKVKSILGER